MFYRSTLRNRLPRRRSLPSKLVENYEVWIKFDPFFPAASSSHLAKNAAGFFIFVRLNLLIAQLQAWECIFRIRCIALLEAATISKRKS
jgi:hypothetical protein